MTSSISQIWLVYQKVTPCTSWGAWGYQKASPMHLMRCIGVLKSVPNAPHEVHWGIQVIFDFLKTGNFRNLPSEGVLWTKASFGRVVCGVIRAKCVNANGLMRFQKLPVVRINRFYKFFYLNMFQKKVAYGNHAHTYTRMSFQRNI